MCQNSTVEATGYNFGNPIQYNPITNKWTYLDGKENTEENYNKLICPKCKLHPTTEGQDPCIANLPGVEFACCGHGIIETDMQYAYIKFTEGKTIRFHTTEEILTYVKENLKDPPTADI